MIRKMNGAKYYLDRIKSKLRKRKVNPTKEHLRISQKNEIANVLRNLNMLNSRFETCLGKLLGAPSFTIIKALKRTHKKGSTLRNAKLMSIPKELNEIRVDNLVTSLSEDFIPSERQDIIIDSYGPISYSKQFLKKDLLLKNALSLKKGGVMLVSFDFLENPIPYKLDLISLAAPHILIKGFSENPKKRKIPIAKEADGIVKALQKRGFKAHFEITENKRLAPYKKCNLSNSKNSLEPLIY